MIAAEAGISQGLSYHYFKSREEIFYFAREAMEEAQATLENVRNFPGSPKEHIRVLVSGVQQRHIPHHDICLISFLMSFHS